KLNKPFDQALSEALITTNNNYLNTQLKNITKNFHSGTSPKEIIFQIPFFSKETKEMLSIGIELQSLPEISKTLAQKSWQDLENKLDIMVKLIEPTITLLIGLWISIIVYSLMKPLLQIQTLI
ncbi:type II secretion system F family protein, partial [Candidatus Margulisiibacteriota bacterium]